MFLEAAAQQLGWTTYGWDPFQGAKTKVKAQMLTTIATRAIDSVVITGVKLYGLLALYRAIVITDFLRIKGVVTWLNDQEMTNHFRLGAQNLLTQNSDYISHYPKIEGTCAIFGQTINMFHQQGKALQDLYFSDCGAYALVKKSATCYALFKLVSWVKPSQPIGWSWKK